MDEQNLYLLVGERQGIEVIIKKFYDYVYDDPWLSQYFKNVPRQIIESQQTEFTMGFLGGPLIYGGRSVKDAHPQLFITEELFDLREYYLAKAFDDLNTPMPIREKWLKVDQAFKSVLIKKSIDDCYKRDKVDEILSFDKPSKKAA